MPIKGISDRPQLTRLGKIRLGIKVGEEGHQYPQATDYFVCPPEVQEVFGERPQVLRVLFPTDAPEDWAGAWYKAYSYRGLVCRGDGEVATRLVDLDQAVNKQTGALPEDMHPQHWPLATWDTKSAIYREIQCPPDSCPQFLAKMCRPLMTLQVMLPEVVGVGVYQIDTSSWNSMRSVYSGIKLVQDLLGGRIAMIPLELRLVPMQVQPGGERPKTVHVLQLRAPYRLADLFRHAALPPARAVLPAAIEPPPEDLVEEEEGELTSEPVPEVASFFDAPEEELPPLETVNDLFRACNVAWRLQPKDVLKALGFSSQQDVGDLKQAYLQVRATR